MRDFPSYDSVHVVDGFIIDDFGLANREPMTFFTIHSAIIYIEKHLAKDEDYHRMPEPLNISMTHLKLKYIYIRYNPKIPYIRVENEAGKQLCTIKSQRLNFYFN